MWYRALSCLVLGAAGCASIHGGPMAVAVDEEGHSLRPAAESHLRISARQLPLLSSCHFGAVEVTFENRSADWISVGQIELDFGRRHSGGQVRLPERPQVRTWLEATLQRNLIRYAAGTTLEQPDMLALGVLRVGWNASDEPGPGVQPPPTDLTTIVAHALDSHLLAVPFSVPPGLFIKKWVLLQSDSAAVTRPLSSAILTYRFADETAARVRMDLSDATGTSEWQRPCRPFH